MLYTTTDPKDAARNADRVVALEGGRLLADQDAEEFARTRLRPRVVVMSPHAARLAAAVAQEARAARRAVEVVAEGGNGLSVYGSDCATIGDTAFRHGVPIHRLADERGDGVVGAGREGGEGRPGRVSVVEEPGKPKKCVGVSPDVGRSPGEAGREAVLPLRHTPHKPVRSPLRPLRYEVHRLLGLPSTALVAAVVLLVSVMLALLLGRVGRADLPAVLAGWPAISPLPPAALGAGVLGAFSFGEEYRYPALTAGRGTVPRRLGLLFAKLVVAATAALVLGVLVVGVDLQVLWLFYGSDSIPVPDNWPVLCASWTGLMIGCAWAGVLGAGVFRAAAAGVAAVLAVPIAFVPLLQLLLTGPSVRSAAGIPARLRGFAGLQWSPAVDRWLAGALRVVGQPAGVALSLVLTGLLCAYVFTGLRRRARW